MSLSTANSHILGEPPWASPAMPTRTSIGGLAEGLGRSALQRNIVRALAAISLVTAVITAYSMGEQQGSYHPSVLALGALLVAAATVTTIADAARGLSTWRSMRSWVVVAGLVGIMGALGRHPPFPTISQAWPVHVLYVGMIAAVPALGWRRGAVVLGAFAVLCQRLGAGGHSDLHATLEALLLAAGALACALIVNVLASTVTDVEAAVTRSWTARLEADGAQARDRERERWDLLIHDKVLGALLVGSRAVSDTVRTAARSLAREALAIIGRPADPTARPDLVGTIAAAILRLGLDGQLSLTVTADPPVAVRRALRDACVEAVTNAARHSGQGQVQVTGTFSGTHAELTISDRGRGFDTDEASARRLGVTRGIHERMRTVGGSATVSSAPGLGTHVHLVWRGRRIHVPVEPWTLQRLGPLLPLGLALIAAHVGLGLGRLDVTRHGWLVGVGFAVIAGATVTVWRPWSHTWPFWLVALSLPAVTALLTWNVHLEGYADYRLWFIGSIDTTVLALAARGFAALSIVAGVGSAAASLALSATGGPTVILATGSTSIQLLAAVVIGLTLRHALDSSAGTIHALAAEYGGAQEEVLAAAARRRERETRLALLSERAVPLLAQLAGPSELGEQDRRACAIVEASLRDSLTARALMNRTLAGAVASARGRGALVDLSAPEGRPAREYDGLRRALDILLPACVAGSTLVLSADRASKDFSIVVVNPDWHRLGPILALGRTLTHPGCTVSVQHDEDALECVLAFGEPQPS